MNAIVHTLNALSGHALPLGREQRALEATAQAPVTLCAVIEGPLDTARLQRALSHVAQRHPATGLAFGHTEGLRGLRQQFAGTPPDWTGAASGMPTLRATVQPADARRSRLTLAAHPLAIDGPSLDTLMRELAQAYANDAAPSAEPPLSYADYLDWTAGLASDNADAGHDYWHAVRGRLRALYAPRLPWRSRTAAPSGTLQAVSVDLADDEATAIAEWAAQCGVPLAHAMQAAWWLLLARLDTTGAFCGGWHNDCRDDFEVLDGAVGRFGSVLPVTVQYDPAAPFAVWLSHFAAQLQQHLDWREHAPHDIAAGASGRIVFGVSGPSGGTVTHGALRWHIGEPQAQRPDVELAADVQRDKAGRPHAIRLYHTPQYPADAVACLLDQYRTLLQTLRAQPGTPAGALPLATAADVARVQAMHPPALDVGTQLLPERLAHWAATRPQAIALSAAGLTWTYAELAQRVDAVASQLPALGVKPGRPVGLLLPRSAELVIALLAVMRAGASYLPLDPAWPVQRQARILADAGATLVIANASLRADPGIPHADAAALLGTAGTPAISHAALQPAQPAYVLYTSGSTGNPKGVAITHGQLANYAAASGRALGLDQCRHFALTSTVAADLGNTTLFGALWHGARLCVASDDDMQNAARFTAFLARERVDCLKIVPSHLDALSEADAAPLPLPPQAVIVMGGEAASPALLARLRARAPSARLCNHYGPTETTVGMLVHDAGRAADVPDTPLPLTRVLANCEATIRTDAGQLATAGETGELYLGGVQLCDGYLHGRTEAFVPHPERPGQFLYRSGDLARYRPDGGIELIGRSDGQVKVRGYRIECGEVEAALAALPGVRQAVVLPISPENGPLQLAAWLVPEAAGASGPLNTAQRHALRQALAAQLPEPMVPAQWFTVAEMPRLPNGKVDRRRLAEAAAAALPTAGHPGREPDTALESLLLGQMRDLLGAPELGVDEDLFEAGGHSLLVIKLVARIRKLLKLDIAPAAIFDAPSAATLAAALRAASADPDGLETLAGLQCQLAAMSPEARAALRASAGATA